eukprot:TRINITY_DN90850_c0_g1_i1.p1 TRINITY_DN90850_c0_g1~~TRINITY_DN90850_c0_g1_i1.p1  ORF type:complete len:527 (+),score=95.71 TRINITY_DN90850_c0_g1_i1:60-1640(+)
MASYILAIDQGTTSSRAVLFDRDGQIHAQAQLEFTQHFPQPGWCEHDPNEILDSVMQCVEAVLTKGQVRKEDIASIGIANQRETTVAWDSETGEPLCPAIVWMDTRTTGIVEALVQEDSGQDRFRKITGLPVSTYFAAVKMRWMLENVPQVHAALAHGRLKFGTVESWLIYRLTGGETGGVHVTDVTNASRYMLMNLETLSWDESLCESIGIPVEVLPKIRSNSEIYGKVRIPLLEGVPLSGAIGDQQAALLGQGCLQLGSSKNTYGTCSCMLVNTGSKAMPSSSGLITTVGYQLGAGAETSYALEGTVAAAGKTIQWLRDEMELIQSATESEAYAVQVPDAGGLTFVPAFSGLFAPHWRHDARAVAVGITLFTRKAHFCRAALESVAFQNVDILRAMRQDTGLQLDSMHVDGGMTANNLLMQMQADLANLTVKRAKNAEATSLGAAMAAALAVGFWSAPEQVKDFLDIAGGYDTFQPQMPEKEREVHVGRWWDALGRSFGLSKWDVVAAAPKKAALEVAPKIGGA